MGLFDRLRTGLKKTRDSLRSRLESVINSFTKIDEELFEEIEEMLILSDIGVQSSMELTEALRDRIKTEGVTDPEAIIGMLDSVKFIICIVEASCADINPKVILIITDGRRSSNRPTGIQH